MSDSLPNQKKLVLISEAAKILGVSIDTIRRWDNSGVLNSVRPDGKNRYFSLDELENYKSKQPLSISEAAKKLGISPTTLRRLEARGVLTSKRNSADERVYDKETLDNFANSDYFLRKKHATYRYPKENTKSDLAAKQTSQLSMPPGIKPRPDTQTEQIKSFAPIQENLEQAISNDYLKIHQRLTEFFGAAIILLLLIAIGVTNISISKANASAGLSASGLTKNLCISCKDMASRLVEQLSPIKINSSTSNVLSETITNTHPIPSPSRYMPEVTIIPKEASETATKAPESSPSSPIKPKLTPVPSVVGEVNTMPVEAEKPKTLTILIYDGADSVNIRQKATIDSTKIGKALSGDEFAFISKDSQWYEVILSDGSTGFISARYVVEGENN